MVLYKPLFHSICWDHFNSYCLECPQFIGLGQTLEAQPSFSQVSDKQDDYQLSTSATPRRPRPRCFIPATSCLFRKEFPKTQTYILLESNLKHLSEHIQPLTSVFRLHILFLDYIHLQCLESLSQLKQAVSFFRGQESEYVFSQAVMMNSRQCLP